jgi:hypothetical protein
MSSGHRGLPGAGRGGPARPADPTPRQGDTHDRSLDRQHRAGAHRDVAARSSAALDLGIVAAAAAARVRSAGERAGRLPPACPGPPAHPDAGLADRSSLGDTALRARTWPARVRGLSRRIRGAASARGDSMTSALISTSRSPPSRVGNRDSTGRPAAWASKEPLHLDALDRCRPQPELRRVVPHDPVDRMDPAAGRTPPGPARSARHRPASPPSRPAPGRTAAPGPPQRPRPSADPSARDVARRAGGFGPGVATHQHVVTRLRLRGEVTTGVAPRWSVRPSAGGRDSGQSDRQAARRGAA